MPPDYSVLICTYNRGPVLAETLAAVADLDLPGPTELIVVDNASTDDTPTVVQRAGERAPFPVEYRREDRAGKSYALNTGIAACQGRLIAFTDDDTRPRRDWLAQLARAFETQTADWVFGPITPIWDGGQPAWFAPELNGYVGVLDRGPDPYVVTAAAEAFFGANCAARREVFARIGTYRLELNFEGATGGGEDTDMFQRALAAGLRIVYWPQATVGHVIPRGRSTKRYMRRRMLQARTNYYRLVLAKATTGRRWLGVPLYLYNFALGDLRAWLWAVVRGSRGVAFYHELRLLTFLGLMQQALAHRGRPATPRLG